MKLKHTKITIETQLKRFSSSFAMKTEHTMSLCSHNITLRTLNNSIREKSFLEIGVDAGSRYHLTKNVKLTAATDGVLHCCDFTMLVEMCCVRMRSSTKTL